MRESEYAKGFTWESTGYKGDNISLALLSAEIQFYDFVLNDPKVKELGEKLNDTPLSEDEKSACELYLTTLHHILHIMIPRYELTDNLINQAKRFIKDIRELLNIKIVE